VALVVESEAETAAAAAEEGDEPAGIGADGSFEGDPAVDAAADRAAEPAESADEGDGSVNGAP
jgi:hypothetical protein